VISPLAYGMVGLITAVKDLKGRPTGLVSNFAK
jgi:hypothetical protein